MFISKPVAKNMTDSKRVLDVGCSKGIFKACERTTDRDATDTLLGRTRFFGQSICNANLVKTGWRLVGLGLPLVPTNLEVIMIGSAIKFLRFLTNPYFYVAPSGMDRPKKARQYYYGFKSTSLDFNKDYYATMFWSLVFGNSGGKGGIENLEYSGPIFEESLRVIHEAVSDDKFLALLNERHSPRSDQFFHELVSKYLSIGKKMGTDARYALVPGRMNTEDLKHLDIEKIIDA